MAEARSTCCYCGVGCGVIIEHDGSRVLGVRGDPQHPANFGRLCSKGSTLHLTAVRQGRALYPQLRHSRVAARERVSWDLALDFAAEQFAGIIDRHGPDAVAFYISGQLLTEDYYVFNKLAKGLIGTNNIDSNSRLCMSSAVAGYKQTLGADAPPACYDDIAHCDCLLIAGANPAYAHPVVYRRIEDAKQANPQLKIIVVDPRRTDTAANADLHLAIEPGTDLVLFNAMLHVLIWEGLVDYGYIRDHTEGFDGLRDRVRDITPAVASQICALSAEDIVTAARWFGRSRAALSMWCQGLNQSTHGTHNTAAIVHLHLATGQIGRPGAGPFSLTGQPNAMGGREVGGMANLLSAHRDLGSDEDRAWVEKFWGVARVPATPGKSAVEMFDAVRDGRIKALWIACTNPAQSMPQQIRVQEALQFAQLVVVQEAFATTETARFADLLLPACTWAEKEGTVTNSERRITHVHPALTPPGEARPDWEIACRFARKLGARLGQDAQRLFPYTHPEAIFREHAQTTRGRDLDIADLTYAVLDQHGPQQWPYRAGTGSQRLFADGRFETPSGRARFVPPENRGTAEQISARYPLRLNTGRLRDQWHGMSRTGRSARLYSHCEEPVLSMHPADLARRGLKQGDLARVSNVRGHIVLRVGAADELKPGHAFSPIHFGASQLSHAGINVLTTSAFDPYSKQPELKHTVVEVEKVELAHEVLIVRTAAPSERDSEQVLRWKDKLQPLLAMFDYAYAGLIGREQPALLVRIANAQPLTQTCLDALDDCLEFSPNESLIYTDKRRNISKCALTADERLVGFRLAGEVAAGHWLREVLTEDRRIDEVRAWLLGPYATPPASARIHGRGRIVCNCHDVAASEIHAALAAHPDLSSLQVQLRCGTSCGSCVPELKRMVTAARCAA